MGQSHGEWQHRRAWSLYDSKNLRLSFKSRLTLVLDKDGKEWGKIMDHYKVRNQIAHGELRSQRIDVSTVIKEFNYILSSLARN